jgi:hypothetical protein
VISFEKNCLILKNKNMSKCICLIVLFIASLSVVQGQAILQREYDYDNAGNRTVRKIISFPPAKSPGEKSTNSQSDMDDDTFYEDKMGNMSLKIFPNPTTSVVKFQIEGIQGEIEGKLMLYNLLGVMVSEQRISSYYTEVDMSSYPTGTYLATMLINGEKTYWKIVKQ